MATAVRRRNAGRNPRRERIKRNARRQLPRTHRYNARTPTSSSPQHNVRKSLPARQRTPKRIYETESGHDRREPAPHSAIVPDQQASAPGCAFQCAKGPRSRGRAPRGAERRPGEGLDRVRVEYRDVDDAGVLPALATALVFAKRRGGASRPLSRLSERQNLFLADARCGRGPTAQTAPAQPVAFADSELQAPVPSSLLLRPGVSERLASLRRGRLELVQHGSLESTTRSTPSTAPSTGTTLPTSSTPSSALGRGRPPSSWCRARRTTTSTRRTAS
jgi:hypothetical protein